MYEELILEAESENIEIVEGNLKGRFKGLYNDGVIAIDKRLTENEKSCIIAEELGHHYTTAGDILDQSKFENRKKEHIARRWGYEKRLPIEKLVEAIKKGCINKYELSKELDVPEWYIDEVIEFYNRKYGDFKIIDNAVVYFNPFNVLILFE